MVKQDMPNYISQSDETGVILVCSYSVWMLIFSCTSAFQAQQLLSACIEKVDVSSTEGYDLFITQLKDGLKNTSHETAANHKVAKVRICLCTVQHGFPSLICLAVIEAYKMLAFLWWILFEEDRMYYVFLSSFV